VFFAADDPSLPDWRDLPTDFPEPLDIAPLPVIRSGVEITYPQHIVEQIKDEHWAVKRLQVRELPIDGHGRLVRLKLAGILAIMDGRTAVNDHDWDLAGQIKVASDALRSRMFAVGQEQAQKAQRDAGHMAGVRVAAQAETVDRIAINKASEQIRRALAGGPLKRKPLKQKINSRLRQADIFNTALQELVDISAVVEADKTFSLK
jgi:hypothetical protein